MRVSWKTCSKFPIDLEINVKKIENTIGAHRPCVFAIKLIKWKAEQSPLTYLNRLEDFAECPFKCMVESLIWKMWWVPRTLNDIACVYRFGPNKKHKLKPLFPIHHIFRSIEQWQTTMLCVYYMQKQRWQWRRQQQKHTHVTKIAEWRKRDRQSIASIIFRFRSVCYKTGKNSRWINRNVMKSEHKQKVIREFHMKL